MGDSGVAVNPKDPRYAHLIGRKVKRAFPPAEIPIVGDEHIDIEFVAKLGNASFVDRAKPEVVDQERARLEEWRVKESQLGEMLDALR